MLIVTEIFTGLLGDAYLIEVEVKASVKDFEEIRKKLTQIGAVKIKTEHQSDVYYNAPHKDFGETDEALRIREIPENGKNRVILTYKGAKLDNVSKTRKEIEVDVSDAENTSLILENLNFRRAASVTKNRDIYHINEFIITLDTVQNVGTYVEIETEANEDEDTSVPIKKIFGIYKQLGIEEGFERRSYLELMGID
jgi:adenylate cyclase class 2